MLRAAAQFLCFIAITVFSVMALANGVDYKQRLDTLEEALKSNPVLADKIFHELQIEKDNMSAEELARFFILQSVKYIYISDFNKAISALEEAERFKPSAASMNLIYLYKATSYLGNNEYQKALDIMSANLTRIEELDNTEIKVTSYLRLVNLYYELEAYEDMLAYAQQALKLSEINNDTKSQCYSLLYIAAAAFEQGLLEKAKTFFNSSHNFCQQNNLPIIVAMSIKGFGMLELKQGNFVAAEQFFLQALKIYKSFNFELEINSVNILLSEAYLGQKKYVEAKAYANRLLVLDEKQSNAKFKARALKVLSELAKVSGDFEKAFQYLATHQQISSTILNDTKAKANAHQIAKFKHQEQAREIALLNKERQLMETQKELDQSAQANNVMIVTMLVGSIFFLSLFLFSSHRQKLRYRKLALIDRLTGVYNRGAGQDFAENEFVQTCLREAHFSVVLFDLDHFKKINDSFGHATGDWALKHVISVVKPLIRDGDIFTRMGGEEFALFLPYSNEEAAIEIAERCQKAIAAIETKYSGHQFSLSASFGVSSNMVDDLSLDTILKRADIALYASKNAGRNQVTRYSKELEKKGQS